MKKLRGCLKKILRNQINTVPKQEKEKAKKFKEYELGFLRMDVTYLPKFKGIKQYLFVAIDRATTITFFGIVNLEYIYGFICKNTYC